MTHPGRRFIKKMSDKRNQFLIVELWLMTVVSVFGRLKGNNHNKAILSYIGAREAERSRQTGRETEK